MSAAVTYVDELVKDYLIYRGFIGTLKALESELKNDKEHSFRVDKIVEQLTNCISNYDLNLLRETWSHLDKRVFSKCELGSYNSVVNKLESSLYKMYIVNCVSNNKNEKLIEFYEKMSPELQGNAEWKDWFALPFIKSGDEHPTFSMYFSRHWMETMLVSLHNFISVSLHTMSVPALLAYDDEQSQLASLQEENEMLKQQVIALKKSQNISSRLGDANNHGSSIPINKPDIMDDFYVIAQETHVPDTQLKSIKSIIRNIGSGLPISPILTRRHQTVSNPVKHAAADGGDNADNSSNYLPGNMNDAVSATTGQSVASTNPVTKSSQANKVDRKPSNPSHVHSSNKSSSTKQKSFTEVKQLTSSPKIVPAQKDTEMQKKKPETKCLRSEEQSNTVNAPTEIQDTTDSKPKLITDTNEQLKHPFLLLSQEEFADHHSVITHCKFNLSGSAVASSDLDGVIKIWSPNPIPKTLSTIVSRSSILSLEWAGKGDRMLLHGNRSGILRLYDTQDKRTIAELASDSKVSLKDYSMLSIASSPVRSSFAVSILHNKLNSADENKLLDCDMKTMKIHRILSMNKLPAATFNCCVFNHNGQLLLGGTSDGRLTLFDVRCSGCIASWTCHENVAVNTVQFSADETSCFSLGANNQFNKWSVNRTGAKLCQYKDASKSTNALSSVVHPSHNITGKVFSMHSDKNLVLMCGQTGGVLKQVVDDSLTTAMVLGGHKSPVVTVDWSTAMDCGMCVTGSIDGRIRVSTLLAQ